MLIVLSPAKTLDYDSPLITRKHTVPDFIDDSEQLIGVLRRLAPSEIGSLMRISDALSSLNAQRYAFWSRDFSFENAKQAVLAFNGDVYDGLHASSLNAKQLDYAQAHIRILSGLYGLLRPLDLMQPYRLEMGTRLANTRGKDLYAFWGESITRALNKVMSKQRSRVLVNLASEEYFKAVKPDLLEGAVITPVFEDWKNGKYKIISFYAKKARGLMARYAAINGMTCVEELKSFDLEGYCFDAAGSTETSWLFRRKLAD